MALNSARLIRSPSTLKFLYLIAAVFVIVSNSFLTIELLPCSVLVLASPVVDNLCRVCSGSCKKDVALW